MNVGANWTRTKIVATLGPATADEQQLEDLLRTGVDVCRLNFSHGSRDEKAELVERIRRLSERLRLPIAILGDLCGPKIRLTKVEGGALALGTGDAVAFAKGSGDSTRDVLRTGYERFVDEVQVGDRIYIDDGLVRLLVLEKTDERLECTVTVGGTISSRKGVNLPDTSLSVPALTEKDREDAKFAVEADLDYVALSFVRRPADVEQLREVLRAAGGEAIPIILKIEKREALDHLGTLISVGDGVMVARGDLGVEMDVWQVPLAQKRLTRMCREAGKPVIIATQMLQSMIENPMPTRAEVSDVSTAIFDAADAVMLSGETAVGKYPSHAVEMMRRVSEASEGQVAIDGYAVKVAETVLTGSPRTSAMAMAAVNAARHLRAKLVVTWTATGRTAMTLARNRLNIPIVALTMDPKVYRRLALYFGVEPLLVEPQEDLPTLTEFVDQLLIEREFVSEGELVVLVSSTRPREPGATDTVVVHRVGERAK